MSLRLITQQPLLYSSSQCIQRAISPASSPKHLFLRATRAFFTFNAFKWPCWGLSSSLCTSVGRIWGSVVEVAGGTSLQGLKGSVLSVAGPREKGLLWTLLKSQGEKSPTLERRHLVSSQRWFWEPSICYIKHVLRGMVHLGWKPMSFPRGRM